MILVDTCVWISHFRRGEPRLAHMLNAGRIACHAHVIGELALGRLKHRAQVLSLLANLPHAPAATHDELLEMIDRRRFSGRGVGYTDAHLLAATLLQPGLRLWTYDKALAALASEMKVADLSD